MKQEFYMRKTSSVYGPLIPSSADKVTYSVEAGIYNFSGDAVTCNGSLCLNFEGKPWTEVRIYNDKIVLFVTRAIKTRTETACYTFAGDSKTKPAKEGDICSVGYYWAE
jgi:hypothetical protein